MWQTDREVTLTPQETQRAIYIDFETRIDRPPALLGSVRTDGDVQQAILDPALESAAAVARKTTTRVRGFADAIRDLLEQADAADAPIVGWSNFDRDVALKADVPDAAREALTRRYRNALETARPWRRAIFPRHAIQPAGPFEPKHTLERYAALAGYDDGGSFREAAPAEWIARVVGQIGRHGHFRRIHRKAKKDWHRLLAYNANDCLALRHVALRAARELAAWRAYESTTYGVQDGAARIRFRIGARSPRLDALVRRHGADRWAFVTAHNPGSIPLTGDENTRRQRELEAELAALGFTWLPGEGSSDDPGWPPERSALVVGIGLKGARSLGRKYGQLAVVAGHVGFPARLISCAYVPRVAEPQGRRS